MQLLLPWTARHATRRQGSDLGVSHPCRQSSRGADCLETIQACGRGDAAEKELKGFFQVRPSVGAALLAHADDLCCWTWNTHSYPPDTHNMVWLSGPERSLLTSSHSSYPALGFGCTRRTMIWSLHSFYRCSILMKKLKLRNYVAAQLAKVIKSNSSPVLQQVVANAKSCKSSSVITSKTRIPSLIFFGGKRENRAEDLIMQQVIWGESISFSV